MANELPDDVKRTLPIPRTTLVVGGSAAAILTLIASINVILIDDGDGTQTLMWNQVDESANGAPKPDALSYYVWPRSSHPAVDCYADWTTGPSGEVMRDGVLLAGMRMQGNFACDIINQHMYVDALSGMCGGTWTRDEDGTIRHDGAFTNGWTDVDISQWRCVNSVVYVPVTGSGWWMYVPPAWRHTGTADPGGVALLSVRRGWWRWDDGTWAQATPPAGTLYPVVILKNDVECIDEGHIDGWTCRSPYEQIEIFVPPGIGEYTVSVRATSSQIQSPWSQPLSVMAPE